MKLLLGKNTEDPMEFQGQCASARHPAVPCLQSVPRKSAHASIHAPSPSYKTLPHHPPTLKEQSVPGTCLQHHPGRMPKTTLTRNPPSYEQSVPSQPASNIMHSEFHRRPRPATRHHCEITAFGIDDGVIKLARNTLFVRWWVVGWGLPWHLAWMLE